MRHSPVIFATLRTAKEDVELGGVFIPAGSLCVVNTAAANRDPAIYEQPDRFVVMRAHTSPMLTFGGGIHYCLGVHLARLELAEALVAMTTRMARPRLVGAPRWKSITGITGPTRLDIEFHAKR